MKRLLILSLTLAISGSAAAQSNVAKIGLLKRFVTEENWDGAVSVGEKLLTINSKDPAATYYTAIAFVNTNRPADALRLLKSLEGNEKLKSFKDYTFWMGRAALANAKPQDAVSSFEAYKTQLKGKKAVSTLEFDHYYSQAKNAVHYMNNPLPISFKNLGETINTEVQEMKPSVNAEGNLLVFSARRYGNVGANTDPYDGKPFEDIWYSTWDTINNRWGEAENLTTVNTGEHESVMSLSPDGSVMFIYVNIPGKTGSGDIWYSKYRGDLEWSRPTEYEGPFNTSYFESSASLATGGKRMFFVSERTDGKSQGQGDIWVCDRKGRREWDKPVNAGEMINTRWDEASVYVAVDGKTVFFSSNSDSSMGGYDIFRTTYVNGKWTTPVNLGYPINTTGDEVSFSISADGKKAYMAAKRPEGYGDFDIYEVDLSKVNILDNTQVFGEGAVLSILKGTVDGDDGMPLPEAKISVYDENGSALISTHDVDEDGNFFITLEGGMKYTVTISANGFKSITQKIALSKKEGSQPFTLNKEFVLDKE